MKRSLLLALVLLFVGVLPVHAAEPPVVVLTPTNQSRDGVPVLAPHPEGAALGGVLSQGFGGHVLNLYQYTQTYLHRQGGPSPAPAYLLLKPGSGGFPKTGFYLGDQDLRQTAYVEVATGPISGRMGSVAQTFVHELMHVIVRQGTAPPGGGRTTQMHSIGVRTDSPTAFAEGFAESMEVMFLEDPEADAATRTLLAGAQQQWQDARQRLDSYRSSLAAPFSPASLTRLKFRNWYPRTEDLLRYAAVKENLFAHQPAIPDRLLSSRNLYGAYLVESILPGTPGDPPKSAARMLQSEGVVSALFYRWASSDALRNAYLDDGFYEQFGATRNAVPPVENVYLKLFDALYTHKPTTAAGLITAYKATFPNDAAAVDQVVGEVLLGQPLPTAPEIWLGNRHFLIGAMVYDQVRQIAHLHTFDLNAASLVDLLGVPGVDRSLAEAILRGAPYASLEEVGQVEGMTGSVMKRLRDMKAAADQLGAGNAAGLLWSYLSGVLLFLALAGAAGGFIYRLLVRGGWVRALLNGVGAALPCLVPFWFLGSWWQGAPLLVPVVLFGLPAAAWTWLRRKDGRQGALKLLAWAVAPLPGFAWLLLRM